MTSITRGFTRRVSHILSAFRVSYDRSREQRQRSIVVLLRPLVVVPFFWCCWLRNSSAVQITLLSLWLVEKSLMEMWYCRGSRSFVRLALSPLSAMIVFRGFHVACHGSVSLTKNHRPSYERYGMRQESRSCLRQEVFQWSSTPKICEPSPRPLKHKKP